MARHSGVKTIEWIDGNVTCIDQTRLPNELIYRTLDDYPSVLEAIHTLQIRGAPAIGIAAAFGMVLGMRDIHTDAYKEFRREFSKIQQTSC